MAVFQFQAADADMDRWKARLPGRSMSFAAYIRSLLDSSGSDRTPRRPERLRPVTPTLPQAPSGKRSFAPDPK
jgi:hypothetical protein